MGQEALKRGRFITLEGGEGAGKTTQLGLLAEALARTGISVLRTREPGGAPGAEEIRRLLVEGGPDRWDAVGEALLVAAARRDHLIATIWPALEQGRWVVCDRFADSTVAYQGYAGGMPRTDLETLHRIAASGFMPDLTLIFDLPPAVGLARAAARHGEETRFERKDLSFHERLRQGFLEIAAREPKRCVVIDAERDRDTIHQTVLAAARDRLGVKL